MLTPHRVTRLIKASKTTRDVHRSSRIMSTLGSTSLSSLPSTNSTITHYSPSTIPTIVTGTGSSPASTNAKLAQAQSELQACEAHLVAKERELDARRISVARDGLGARCRALIDCGWVWGEMGKQGLRALQALTTDGSPPHAGTSSFHVVRDTPLSHGETVYTTYASDNSSLTPSQSASQTAARSAETSHEGTTSRDHEPITSDPDSHGDLTLTLPPAHAISDFTVPTLRSRSPHNGDAAPQKPKPLAIAPAPRRTRTKRVLRPPSQHITEVSDEGSDTGPFPAPSSTAVPTTSPVAVIIADPNTGNTDPSTSAPRPFPTHNEDTSSDDDAPFQIVENDPFEVIRRSMLGTSPSVPLLPVQPGTRDGLSGSETSPSRAAFSLGRAAGASVGGTPKGGRRERRTSILGSLRGLFRKPKEREREGAELDNSPKPNISPNGHRRGWVTRTDTRIGNGRRDVDSDSELRIASVTKGNSGSRLRKGRQRGTNEGAVGVGVDGWITDGPRPSGVVGTAAGVTSTSGAGLERARTRRGAMKRKKTSVADLRGSEQGHTDGEMDGPASRSLARTSSKAKAEIEEAAVKLGRHVSAPAPKGMTSDSRADIDVQHVRAATATTTTATRTRNPSETHRRSASVDARVAVVSTSTSGATWRKASPPAPFKSGPASRTPSPSPPRTPPPASSSAPMPAQSSIETKKQQRRAIGNGHAKHGHAQNQSLMSIVADVTHPKNRDDAEREKMRSLDVPRAPGPVLREAENEVAGTEGSGRGRGRRSSWTVGAGEVRVVEQGQGQGRGRGVVKMPLRSALRNASRTPSPSPSAVPVRAENGEKMTPASGLGKEDERAVSPSSFRDSMSVSSYATVPESLSEDDARPEPVLTIPPPPAVDPPKEGSTERLHVRRKSVRMSLQPTFSPSPPALEDEDVGWGDSEKRRSKPVSDVWADSSSEEEAYQRGRALLSLVGKADTFKAKALNDKARR